MTAPRFSTWFKLSIAAPLLVGSVGALLFWLFYRFSGLPFDFRTGFLHVFMPLILGSIACFIAWFLHQLCPQAIARAGSIIVTCGLAGYVAVVLMDRAIIGSRWADICNSPNASFVDQQRENALRTAFFGNPIPMDWLDDAGITSGSIQLAGGCHDICVHAVLAGLEVIAQSGPGTEYEYVMDKPAMPSGPVVWLLAKADQPTCKIDRDDFLAGARLAAREERHQLAIFYQGISKKLGPGKCLGYRSPRPNDLLDAYRQYQLVTGLYSQGSAIFYNVKRRESDAILIRTQIYNAVEKSEPHLAVETLLGPSLPHCGANLRGILIVVSGYDRENWR